VKTGRYLQHTYNKKCHEAHKTVVFSY